MNELIKRLEALQTNCGDNLGRDGLHLDDEVGKILGLAKLINTYIEELADYAKENL
jgi:hypothetical protein